MPRARSTENIEKRAARQAKASTKKPKEPPKSARNLTSSERVKRDLALIQDRILMGLTWGEISAKHGLSQRQAQKVFLAYKDAAQVEMRKEDALELALEAILRLRTIQQKFATIAESGDNDNVRIAALRSIVETFWKEIELRQHMGMLPKNLGELHLVADVRYVSSKLVMLFEKYGLPKEAKAELLDLIAANRSMN